MERMNTYEEIKKQLVEGGIEDIEEEALSFVELYEIMKSHRTWKFMGQKIYPEYGRGIMIIPHNQWGNDLKGEVVVISIDDGMWARLKSGVFYFRIVPHWIEDFRVVSFGLSLQIPSCRLDGDKCILPSGEVIPSDLYYYIETDGKLGTDKIEVEQIEKIDVRKLED